MILIKPLLWTHTPPPGLEGSEYPDGTLWADGIGGHYCAEPNGTLWYAHDGFRHTEHSHQLVAMGVAHYDYMTRMIPLFQILDPDNDQIGFQEPPMPPMTAGRPVGVKVN